MSLRNIRATAAIVIGLAAVAPPVFAQGYYDWLVSQPELHSAVALKNQSEVTENLFFSDKSKGTTTYDSQRNAARFIVPSNKGSVVVGDQVRHEFPYVDSGNLLVYWEALAPGYWARDGDVDGVKTYKAFQLSHDGELTLEFRYRFSQVDRPFVARNDVRVYGDQAGVEIGSGDSAAPQAGEFNMRPDKWTRFWAFIDFANNRLSYWIADEDREPVKVLDSIPFNWRQNYGSRYGFNEFWFEFNTSQSRSGPTAYMYGRNLAVLRNVADPAGMVAGYSVTRPQPPTLNQPVTD